RRSGTLSVGSFRALRSPRRGSVTRSGGRALRLAHRGDWRGAPENTLPALLAALDVRGCDGLEFDVRGSSDGVPILQHDETLALALELGCAGVSVEWHAVRGPAVRRAQAAGLDVAAWTIRRRATFDRLARLGVMAMCVEGAALDG